MRFEHLIQINAPADRSLPVLARAHVWRGLALRAYDPAHFIMGLEGCAIRDHRREDDGREHLTRTLHFGSFEVEDTVTLEPELQTRVAVEASANWPRCTATARIEEPEPQSLFIRFTYEWDDADAAEIALTDDERRLREQACLAMDMDTVARIRELASGGMA